MMTKSLAALPTPIALLASLGCSDPVQVASDPCMTGGGDAAVSTCLSPRYAPEYYVREANRYFDALDMNAPPESVPTYSELVARWEWPPWLKLTGYTRQMMADTDAVVKKMAPASISHRDCVAVPAQPFARCRVSFDYAEMGDGKPCPIYEEFTFNDQGEITFVEAWSDRPEFLPGVGDGDRWAQGGNLHRMSTKVPGLGNATGRIDLDSAWMGEAAAADPEIADFVARARDFWGAWFAESRNAGSDYFERGCGW